MNELKKYPDHINGFAIEFHDLKNKLNDVKEFIKSCTNYKLIHIHGNNLAIDNERYPLTLEMTFCHTKLLKNFSEVNNKNYPISGLDSPNAKRAEDVKLYFDEKN